MMSLSAHPPGDFGVEGAAPSPAPPEPSAGPRPDAGRESGTSPAAPPRGVETGMDARAVTQRLRDIYTRFAEAIRRDDAAAAHRLLAEAHGLVDKGRRAGPPPDPAEMAEVFRLVDEARLVLAQRLADLREKQRLLRRGRRGLRGYADASGTG